MAGCSPLIKRLKLGIVKLAPTKTTSSDRLMEKRSKFKRNPTDSVDDSLVDYSETRISREQFIADCPEPTDVLIFGDQQTGKSTLINRLQLHNSSKSFLSPNAMSYNFIECTNVEDCYQTTSAIAYIVTYAVDSRPSFQYAVNCIAPLKHSKNSNWKPIFLIGNKIDFYRKDEKLVQAGQIIAKTFGAKFVQTSGLMNRNMDQLWSILRAEISANATRRSSQSNLSVSATKLDQVKSCEDLLFLLRNC